MGNKRTYTGYGKALEGAHLILDPEERVAVRHTYVMMFLLGMAAALISEALAIGFAIIGVAVHLFKLHIKSKRGEV